MNTATKPRLPRGQHRIEGDLPRFGLPRYVRRWAVIPPNFRLEVGGDITREVTFSIQELLETKRQERTLDLHCVTTWSATELHWSGQPFRDIWQRLQPLIQPGLSVAFVQAFELDGYAASVPLDEAFHQDCLFATHLNGQPLTRKHGAPLRLVVPQLYGYKSVKHLYRLEFTVRPARTNTVKRLLSHPRGRVDLEERSSLGFQPMWRWLYRWQLPNFMRMSESVQNDPGLEENHSE